MADKKKASTQQSGGFWSTLPGILTAITGLIVAITGLVTVLGENGLLDQWQNQQGTQAAATAGPTPFPTITPIDSDVILPTLDAGTPQPTEPASSVPACGAFSAFNGQSNPNGVVVAYSDGQAWVSYGFLPLEAAGAYQAALLFDTSPASAACLRAYLKYLGSGHTMHWPQAEDGSGREVQAVWLSSAAPPLVGELAGWEDLPDDLVITVVDDTLNPQFVGYFACGADVPDAVKGHIAFYHAGTSERAVQGYLELYSTNGYALAEPVECSE